MVGTFKHYKKTGIRKAREIYSPFPYKCLRAYRINGIVELEIPQILCNPWENKELYVEAINWIIGSRVGEIDSSSTLTAGNGEIYHFVINFKTHEDRLAFCLRYPELV